MAVNLLPMALPGSQSQDDGGGDLDMRRKLAELMMRESMQRGGQKIEHPLQGVAHMVDSLTAALMYRNAGREAEKARQQGATDIMDMLQAQSSRQSGPSMPETKVAALPPPVSDAQPGPLPLPGASQGDPKLVEPITPAQRPADPPVPGILPLGDAMAAYQGGPAPQAPVRRGKIDPTLWEQHGNAVSAPPDVSARGLTTGHPGREALAATLAGVPQPSVSPGGGMPTASLPQLPPLPQQADTRGINVRPVQSMTVPNDGGPQVPTAPSPANKTGWAPKNLILHDYGGSPKNADGVFNPYHALVFPDGSIRYRNADDPYGQKAPHAYRMNPDSIGLSYAGGVGSTPTPEAMATLRKEYEKINQMFPGIRALGHGEAYQQTRGTPQQASRLGRDLSEASWRTQLQQAQPQPGAPVKVADAGGQVPQQVAQAQPQPQSQAQQQISPQEMSALRRMIQSRDPATRNAGLQMLQQYQKRFMPLSQGEQLDQDYKRAQIEQLRRKDGKTHEVNGKLIKEGPDGKAAVIYDGGADFSKLPEYSAKAAGFAARMVDAEKNVRRIMETPGMFDATSVRPSNALPEFAGNWVRTEGHQQYVQAARQWIRAFLRKESGAAISEGEFKEDFKTYFPQPGDSADVVKQKEAARLEAKRSITGESRGFFEHNNPQHARQLKEWQTPKEPGGSQTQQPQGGRLPPGWKIQRVQ